MIPAAAGGPKGLILQGLDQWIFGEWLASAPRERSLIGASIGAWRMAAASHADPAAAFQRLGKLYCEQRYPLKPSAACVSKEISALLNDFIGGHEHEIVQQPLHQTAPDCDTRARAVARTAWIAVGQSWLHRCGLVQPDRAALSGAPHGARGDRRPA